MSSSLIVAVSSKSGCGNSTVSGIVAKRLGIRLVNYTFHDMARERGVSFEEFCRMAQMDLSYDRELDRRQVALARESSCVLASRLAIWLLSEAQLKVYLTAGLPTRSRRIAGREGIPEQVAHEQTRRRDERDRERYRRLYGIDVDDFSHADLVVDTEAGDQHYVAERILERITAEGLADTGSATST